TVHQRKPKVALSVRTRGHWILLTNTRQANYTANFSKCLPPLLVRTRSGARRCAHRFSRRLAHYLTEILSGASKAERKATPKHISNVSYPGLCSIEQHI